MTSCAVKPCSLEDLKDPVLLTQRLIACPSVTPIEGGALEMLELWLRQLGFECHRLSFDAPGTDRVENVFAIRQSPRKNSPHLCFAGHTDVVPPGNLRSWDSDPFEAQIHDGVLYGRGAVDMKGAIAAFIAAIAEQDAGAGDRVKDCTVSFLITGDEEGVALNGTRQVLPWLQDQHYIPDFCLVGEPSSQEKLGDTIKIGRRGSLNTVLTIQGIQGHVAFPERAQNPVTLLISILHDLNQGPPEPKSKFFDASNLEVTSIDVGNLTTNLIPETATARFNIRFNDQHTGESLATWIKTIVGKHTTRFTTEFEFSGEAEFLQPNSMTDLIADCVQEITGLTPVLSTAGATSDARFIRHYCPVIEFGLVGKTMHQANERVDIEDLKKLKMIYQKILSRF